MDQPGDVDRTAILIKNVSLRLDKHAVALLSPLDLTPAQYRVIKLLLANIDTPLRHVDIEQRCALTAATTTGIIQNLEGNGWAERVPNPDDARSKLVIPSPKAAALRQELNAVGEEIDQHLVSRLNEAERAQLIALLKKLLG